MAYYRCGASASNGGDALQLCPEGKVITGSTIADFVATRDYSMSPRGGLAILNGKDVKGKTITLSTTLASNVPVALRFFSGTIDNLSISTSSQTVSVNNSPLDYSLPNDFDVLVMVSSGSNAGSLGFKFT